MSRYNARHYSDVMKKLGATKIVACRAAARDISKEIQRNFDAGVNENRVKWKKLSAYTNLHRRWPSKPILTQTEKGRRSIKVSPLAGGGMSINIGVQYMVYHQRGAPPRLPKRSFVPERVMPKSWNEILFYHYEKTAKAIVGG